MVGRSILKRVCRPMGDGVDKRARKRFEKPLRLASIWKGVLRGEDVGNARLLF